MGIVSLIGIQIGIHRVQIKLYQGIAVYYRDIGSQAHRKAYKGIQHPKRRTTTVFVQFSYSAQKGIAEHQKAPEKAALGARSGIQIGTKNAPSGLVGLGQKGQPSYYNRAMHAHFFSPVEVIIQKDFPFFP